MLLPPGIETHKNLSTSFTRFEHLLQNLAENRFGGYIKLNFWGYEGVLVLDTGHIIEAYSAEDEVFLTGPEGVLAVIARANRQEDGTIEVHELPSEVALALAYSLQAREHPENDVFANYALSQIFDLVERDSLNGYVDIEFSGKKGNGTIYYLEGIPIEAVIMSSSGRIFAGETVYGKFLEIAEMIQPQVTVYAASEPKTIVEDQAFIIPWQHQKYLSFWQDFLNYLQELLRTALKYNKFRPHFEKICQEASDPYPFLNPQRDHVVLNESSLQINSVLSQGAFVQGMTFVLNRILWQIPVRRFRNLDLGKIRTEVTEMAVRHEVQCPHPHELVQQVFRGILT